MIIRPRISKQPKRRAWSREQFIHERSIALGQTIATSTWDSYGSALNSYLEFCHLHHFDTDPTPETLSFYTVFMSHHIKPDSVDAYLSGICHQLEPLFPSVRTHRNSSLVTRTLKGCKRLYGSPIIRKRALTLGDLETMVRELENCTAHDDKLFVALLLTGFFALMRLGELTDADKVRLRNPRKTIRRNTVTIDGQSYSFFLPGHKGDRFFEGNTIIIPANERLYDPQRHFTSYLASRDEKFPLFFALWLREDGTVPTRSWFVRRLRRFFDKSVAGQSMRAGGATLLAELGTAPHLIQATGRWKSESFQLYIRKHPVLLNALILARRVDT